MSANFEDRLDQLRTEAARNGKARSAAEFPAQPGMRQNGSTAGYYGLPVVKPPVWTWEISVSFFVGAIGGMSGVIAPIAWFTRHHDVASSALWLASVASIISPILLTMDLGRPWLFLHMLRVFKWRSPMSMGAWILTFFAGCSVPGLIAAEVLRRLSSTAGVGHVTLEVFAALLMMGAAVFGSLLATYTGVLLGATVIPAWFTHRRLLPAQFGIAAIGAAAAALELLGHRLVALNVLGYLASIAELLIWLVLESNARGVADRGLREGRAGSFLRLGGILTGPAALLLRILGQWFFPARLGASAAFLVGALLQRFGWIEGGRNSGRDPEAVFASQGK